MTFMTKGMFVIKGMFLRRNKSVLFCSVLFSIKGDSVILIAWSEVSMAMTRPSVMELNNGELECKNRF